MPACTTADPAIRSPPARRYHCAMGRALRPYLPGVVFHVTARVHDRERLFVGLQAPIAGLIRSTAQHAGARLVAYVVMSNHLHALVVQGRQPLGVFMQPLMRRTALLVQRTHDRAGHVFERRYAARACLDAPYLRNAIAYIHLNPVRAGLCDNAADYAWSTHRLYCGLSATWATREHRAIVDAMLQAFAASEDAGRDECRQAYLAFLRWRVERDRAIALGRNEAYATNCDVPAIDCCGMGVDCVNPQAVGTANAVSTIGPDCRGGDLHWAHSMAPFVAAASAQDRLAPTPRAALAVVAAAALREVEPEMPLELLRGGGAARPVAHARRPVIARCLDEGYTPGQVARFLRVSTSTVSRVSSALRSADSA